MVLQATWELWVPNHPGVNADSMAPWFNQQEQSSWTGFAFAPRWNSVPVLGGWVSAWSHAEHQDAGGSR